VNGRKRHLLVDTEGLVLRVAVLAAQIPDRDAAIDLFDLAQPVCPRIEQVWADSAYAGRFVDRTMRQWGWRLVIVSKPPDQQGFVVHPRRWVVERSFGWLGRNRRLAKDYEELNDSSEAWVYLAAIRLMLRRRVA
jgi:putative transposase